MQSYWIWFKDNLRTEWRFANQWQIYVAIIVGALFQYIHNVAHNYVYYLAGKYRVYGGPGHQLVDMGFLAFEDAADLWWVPNISLYFLAALASAFIASILVTRKIITNPDVHVAQALWRILIVACICIGLRCVSFLITILPAPAVHCHELFFDPPTSTEELFAHFDVGAGCSDLIFSGHQMNGMLAAVTVNHYTVMGLRGYVPSRMERIIKYLFVVFCYGVVLLEGISIVRQQSHYSIDVFTSVYAVPLTWVAFYHFFPKDPTPNTEVVLTDKSPQESGSATSV